MQGNTLFADNQHWFISGRSRITQLLETIEDLRGILDAGGSIGVVCMDFIQAVDTVSRLRLLSKAEKLTNNDISYRILKSVEAFLSSRRQRVEINGVLST